MTNTQLTHIQIDNYGPWTVTPEPRREVDLQTLQSRLYADLSQLFGNRDAYVFFTRFDNMIAVSNGVDMDDHALIQESVGNRYPVTMSLSVATGTTPADALGTATYGRLYIDYRYDESETSALTTGTWFGQAMTVEGKTTTFDFVYLVDGEPETEAVEQLLTDVEAHDVSGVDNSVSSNTIEVTGSFETAKLTQDLTDLTLGDAYSLVYPLPGGN